MPANSPGCIPTHHHDEWKMIASEDVPADAENEYKSTYMIFDRK
jgi:hypothetical protein